MADLQTQFVKFHDSIKLDNLDENATLREKRDIVLEKLRTNLAKDFAERGEKAPTFDTRNQGSYAMGVGVKPLNGDFDIDVAVVFNIAAADYQDPTKVKAWVYEALRGHTCFFKRPCVTVQYQRKGDPLYHVDLAIYSNGAYNLDGKTRLARGFPGSTSENKVWEPSDFVALCTLVNGRFSGPDAAQFRRVIRYLKRWKDHRFSSNGNAAPVGIVLTCAAYEWFQPVYKDRFAGTYDDLNATRNLVASLSRAFSNVWFEGERAQRLQVKIPVEPWDNPGDRMSNKQMEAFEVKTRELLVALDSAIQRADPVEAARDLRTHFGEEFPIPDRKSTGMVGPPPIISSGQSA